MEKKMFFKITLTKNLLSVCLVLVFLLGFGPPARSESDIIAELRVNYKQYQQLERQGKYHEALFYAQKVAEMSKEAWGAKCEEYAETLNNLGQLYYHLGSYGKAERFFKQNLAILEKILGPNHLSVASSLNNLAALYCEIGLYSKAEPLYKRSLDIKKKVLKPNHPLIANSLNNLGQLYLRIGSFSKAEHSFKQALAISEKASGPKLSTAYFMSNLASLYKTIGSYSEAELLYKQSLTISEKVLGTDHPDMARFLNNLAVIYEAMGSYAKAALLYKRSLAISEKVLGHNHPVVATTLNNLGVVYSKMGSYSKAEPLYKRSLAIREKVLGPNHRLVADSQYNLGELYFRIGSYSKAEPLVRQTISIYKKTLGPNHPRVAYSLNCLGRLYLLTGSYSKAEHLFTQTLAISEKSLGSNHPDVGNYLNNLAVLYQMLGFYSKAEPLYKRSLAIREKALSLNHPDVEASLNNLAILCAASGKQDKAHALQMRAQKIDQKLIDQISGAFSEEQTMNLLYLQRRTMEQTLSLVVHDLLMDPKARRDAYSVWLLRKGISLDAQKDFQAALFHSDDPQVLRTFEELSQTRAQLTTLSYAGLGEQGPRQYQEYINTLEKQKDALESKLAGLSQAYAREHRRGKATVEEVAGAMPQNSVLIDIAKIRYCNFKAKGGKQKFWLSAHYLAFVLHPGKPDDVGLVDLGPAQPIDNAIAAYKTAMEEAARNPDNLKGNQAPRYAARLYELVFSNLEPYVGAARTLLVSPDGQLNLVPFEIFRDGRGKYLVERFAFNYLNTSRDLVGFTMPAQAKSNPPLLIGNPDFDLNGDQRRHALAELGFEKKQPMTLASVRSADLSVSFKPLPHTGQEVTAIKAILGSEAKVYTRENALEEVLENSSSPRILHLATHGFFLSDTPWKEFNGNDRGIMLRIKDKPTVASSNLQGKNIKIQNPLIRSGIALAGANLALKGEGGKTRGIMTAEKILGLDLRGTDLVVLSACETGEGQVKTGEGVFGLRRSFTQVGAKSIIMSMWKVPDQETQELMISFYKDMRDGQDRCTALRQAALKEMQTAKDRYGTDNPYYWGAFVFLGQAK